MEQISKQGIDIDHLAWTYYSNDEDCFIEVGIYPQEIQQRNSVISPNKGIDPQGLLILKSIKFVGEKKVVSAT